VRDSPADVRAFEMLVENLQRENLSDEEEATAYRILIDQGYTVEQIATRLGVSKSRVSRNHRIFSHDTLAPAVAAGHLTKSQAQELLVAPHDMQSDLVELVATTQEQGQQVPQTALRTVVTEINAALNAGEEPESVMASVAQRTIFHNDTKVAAHTRRTPADRAADELAQVFERFLATFKVRQVSPERIERIDALTKSYSEWCERGMG
jgi:ParB-like chromosome segregation protein Spo0J